MEHKVYYLSERDVVNALTMPVAIEALKEMLRLQGEGKVKNIPKALGVWGDGSSMHALGSVMNTGGYAGFKTWTNTKRGGGSIFTLFDADTGLLLAIMEARALGMMRTAAVSGVATQLLSPQNSNVAALIGTGPQAVSQLAALAAVRDLKRVQVFSPTKEKRDAFVKKLAPRYDIELVACDDLEEALEGAEILTTITRASEPIIFSNMLKNCRHINAVGAILPTKAEFDQSCLKIADQLVMDDKENAQRGSRELREFFGDHEHDWINIPTLGEMLARGDSRSGDTHLSFFKGMGMGLADLAMAKVVYEHAVDRNSGVHLAPQTRQNLLLD